MARASKLAIPLLLCAALPAHGAFLIEQKAPEPAVTAASESTAQADLGAVVILGDPNFRGDQLLGFGREITLWDAIGQIIPKGWETDLDPNAADQIRQVVTWRGGTPWVESLRSMLQSTALVAEVEPSIRTVRFYMRSDYLLRARGLSAPGGSRFTVEIAE